MKAKFSLVALLAIALAALMLVGCTTSTAPSSSAQLPYIPIDQVPATVGPNPLPRSIGQYSFIGYTDGVLSNSRFFAVLAYDGRTMFLADINLFHNIITAVRIRGLSQSQSTVVQKALQDYQRQLSVTGRMSIEDGDIVWTIANEGEMAEISVFVKQTLQRMPPPGQIPLPTALPVAPAVVPALASGSTGDGLVVFIVCGDGRCDPIFPQTAMTGSMDLSRVRVIRRIGGAVPQNLPQILAGFERETGLPVKTIFVSTHGTFANGMCVGCGGQGGFAVILDDPLGAGAKIPAEVGNWLPANLHSPDVLDQVSMSVDDVVRLTGGKVEVVGMVQSSDTWYYRVRYHGPAGAELRVTPVEWQTAAKANWVSVPQIKWTAQIQPSQNVQDFFARMGANEGAARSAAQTANFAGGQSFKRIVVDVTGLPLQAIDPALFAGADPAFVIWAGSNSADAAAQLSYAWAHIKPGTEVYINVPKVPASAAVAAVDALDRSQAFTALVANPAWKGKVTLLTIDGNQVVSRMVLRESGQSLAGISLVAGGSNPPVPSVPTLPAAPAVAEMPQFKVAPPVYIVGSSAQPLVWKVGSTDFGWIGGNSVPTAIQSTQNSVVYKGWAPPGYRWTQETLKAFNFPITEATGLERLAAWGMKGGAYAWNGLAILGGTVGFLDWSNDKLGWGETMTAGYAKKLSVKPIGNAQQVVNKLVGEEGLEWTNVFHVVYGPDIQTTRNLLRNRMIAKGSAGVCFLRKVVGTNTAVMTEDIPTSLLVCPGNPSDLNSSTPKANETIIFTNLASGEQLIVTWDQTSAMSKWRVTSAPLQGGCLGYIASVKSYMTGSAVVYSSQYKVCITDREEHWPNIGLEYDPVK